MASPLIVFISSVIAGMSAERRAAQAAVQALPIARQDQARCDQQPAAAPRGGRLT